VRDDDTTLADMVDELRMFVDDERSNPISSSPSTYLRGASNLRYGPRASAQGKTARDGTSTTDYAREAIFSMLESRGGLSDLVVADLYCGSGPWELKRYRAVPRGSTLSTLIRSVSPRPKSTSSHYNSRERRYSCAPICPCGPAE